MVCWLFVGSSIFSAAFALLGGQDLIERWVLSLGLTTLQFMLLSQFIIFILGWPLEWTEIIVIFMPIFIPLLPKFGVDPLFFGLLVALNLQTAFLSPPVAMAAFYLKGVSPKHVTLNQIFAGMMPFMGIQVVALALLYIWPADRAVAAADALQVMPPRARRRQRLRARLAVVEQHPAARRRQRAATLIDSGHCAARRADGRAGAPRAAPRRGVDDAGQHAPALRPLRRQRRAATRLRRAPRHPARRSRCRRALGRGRAVLPRHRPAHRALRARRAAAARRIARRRQAHLAGAGRAGPRPALADPVRCARRRAHQRRRAVGKRLRRRLPRTRRRAVPSTMWPRCST